MSTSSYTDFPIDLQYFNIISTLKSLDIHNIALCAIQVRYPVLRIDNCDIDRRLVH